MCSFDHEYVYDYDHGNGDDGAVLDTNGAKYIRNGVSAQGNWPTRAHGIAEGVPA